jgi:transposase
VSTPTPGSTFLPSLPVSGERIENRDFPATGAGINRAIAWVARRTEADLATLRVIEGAASYGAVLAGAVAAAGYQVAEATRMDALPRRGVGKSDPLDAHRTASAVLSLEEDKLRRPRLNEGVRAALRVLVTARHSMTTDRTRTVNALTALLRINDLGFDARKSLSGSQIREVSRWRVREEAIAVSVARSEAVRLAKRIGDLDAEIKANGSRITGLVEVSEAAPLLQDSGFGPVNDKDVDITYRMAVPATAADNGLMELALSCLGSMATAAETSLWLDLTDPISMVDAP